MRRAFTLIELLVVIAVIAVLAAILFPVFVKARERAKQAHCINNMRQIGYAIGVYLVDWEQKYPWARDTSSVYYGRYGSAPAWYDVLSPYLSTRDLLRCPSDIGEVHAGQKLAFPLGMPPFWKFMSSSYDYPGLGGGLYWIAGRGTSYVRDPSAAWLVSESRPWHDSPNPRMPFRYDPARMNIVYCDGHSGRLNWLQWESARDWKPTPG